MNRSTLILSTLGIIALIGCSCWFLLNKPVSVRTVVIHKTTALDAVPASVKVEPEFELTITSDVAGLIKDSTLKLGQIVKKGDILMEIDPGGYELELKKLSAELENLDAQYALDYDQQVSLKKQKEDLEYYERRTAKGEYPKLELERRRDEFRIFQEQQQKQKLVQEQRISNIKHSIRLQQDNIKMCTIRAPAAGTVTEIYAQPGEVVSVRSGLVRLFSESLLVQARINEEDFSGITIGLDASVRFLAYGMELYDAKVVKVLPNADPANQQYSCFLEVEIAQDRLIPGLSGEASIIRNRRENTLVAPRSTLYNGSVFRIQSGSVEKLDPTIGFKSMSAVEFLDTLAEGDQLAVTQLSSLRDGKSIRILE